MFHLRSVLNAKQDIKAACILHMWESPKDSLERLRENEASALHAKPACTTQASSDRGHQLRDTLANGRPSASLKPTLHAKKWKSAIVQCQSYISVLVYQRELAPVILGVLDFSLIV